MIRITLNCCHCGCESNHVFNSPQEAIGLLEDLMFYYLCEECDAEYKRMKKELDEKRQFAINKFLNKTIEAPRDINQIAADVINRAFEEGSTAPKGQQNDT